MGTYLGIGLGPIQTGIFIAGAAKGGFDRIVIAEVDQEIVKTIRNAGSITINIAEHDKVRQEKYSNIEIYNPLNADDLSKLIQVASEASELSTALPGITFYKHITPWLRRGFMLNPNQTRYIYTAENHNRAAELLKSEIDLEFKNLHFLNTVIGKMSKVFTGEGKSLVTLCDGLDKGHLVEAFNRIYISCAPGIEQRRCKGLFQKENLLPFEEAKLYGHNATHFLLGWEASKNNLQYMSELAGFPELIDYGRKAFFHEAGRALCKKWSDVDSLFTREGFKNYVENLLERIVNPFLQDSVDRIIRDLPRKLEYEDRVIGTIKLCLEQKVIPKSFITLAGECFLR